MSEEIKTRVESLLPEMFEEEGRKISEDRIEGLGEEEGLVWKQLESQTKIAWKNVKDLETRFMNLIAEYRDEYEDMVIVQRALLTLNSFGSFLRAIQGERMFLLGKLNSYLKKVEKAKEVVRETEKVREKVEGKIVKIPIFQHGKSKKERNLYVYELYQAGQRVTDIAKTLGLKKSTVSVILKKAREQVEKKRQKEIKQEFDENAGKNVENVESDEFGENITEKVTEKVTE